MAKLTQEQVNKWNEKNGNGFKFDIQYFFNQNEKTIRKLIEIEAGKVLEARLMYYPEYETKINEYGCKWTEETGRELPTLHVAIWNISENGAGTSHGLGKNITVGVPQGKKNFITLQSISHTLTDDIILEHYKKAYVYLKKQEHEGIFSNCKVN